MQVSITQSYYLATLTQKLKKRATVKRNSLDGSTLYQGEKVKDDHIHRLFGHNFRNQGMYRDRFVTLVYRNEYRTSGETMKSRNVPRPLQRSEDAVSEK